MNLLCGYDRLENALRNFSTLTKGDNLEILYNDKIYGILVMEIKPPGVGISIVETDLEVDFAPPVGYQEPTPVPRSRPVLVWLYDDGVVIRQVGYCPLAINSNGWLTNSLSLPNGTHRRAS